MARCLVTGHKGYIGSHLYKKLKQLKPYQIKLLEEGAKSQSQAWLINQMWTDWKEIQEKIKIIKIKKEHKAYSNDFEKAFKNWKEFVEE